MLIIGFRFNLNYLENRSVSRHCTAVCAQQLTHNNQVLEALDLPNNYVIFNTPGRQYVETMFYTGLPAYNFIPSLEQWQALKELGKEVAIFLPKTPLPQHLKTDAHLIIIEEQLQGAY